MLYLEGSDVFPLKFCGHRWLENVPCAERALQVWPHIKVYVAKVKGHKDLEPSCKSFKSIEQWTKDPLLEARTPFWKQGPPSGSKDPLLEARVEAFLSVARDLQPFLHKYQTDSPMLPFLAEDMLKMIKRLLSRYCMPFACKIMNMY